MSSTVKSSISRTAGFKARVGSGARLSGQLQPGLLEVVRVEVRVAERVHELAGLEADDLGDHLRQQRVGRDVEGHAQEHVGGRAGRAGTRAGRPPT